MSNILRPDFRTTLRLALAPALMLLLLLGLAGRAEAAAGWGPPTTVSAEGTPSSGPALAGDPSGRQLVAWQVGQGSGSVIEAATRDATGDWSAPVEVSEATDVGSPDVAVNASGEAFVAWVEGAGGNQHLEYSRGDDSGGPWTTPATVPSSSYEYLGEPILAINASGEVLISWLSIGGTAVVVAAREDEGHWSGETTLNSSSAPGARPTVAALEEDGEAILAWSVGLDSIEAATSKVGGSWTTQTLASGSGDYGSPKLAVDGAGRAVVAWPHFETSGPPVEMSQRVAPGSWGSPETIPTGGSEIYEVSLAMDPTDAETLVWSEFPTGFVGDRIARTVSRPAGGPWTTPITLGTSTDTIEPTVTATADGGVDVGWREEDQTTKEDAVALIQRSADGEWGPEQVITEEGEELYGMTFDLDQLGGVTAAWGILGGGKEEVRSAYLAPPAPEPSQAGGGTSPSTPVTAGGDASPTPAGAASPKVCMAPATAVAAQPYTPTTTRAGATVSGVRARISVPTPSAVSVAATITWKKDGKRHSVAAGNYSMTLASLGNLRIPLPAALRGKLPLGTKVGVSLRIATTPTGSSPCAAPTSTTRKLSLKVVKVLASAK
jgi:hypothetical protein